MKGIYRQVRRLKPRQGRVERNSRDDAEEGFALSLSLSLSAPWNRNLAVSSNSRDREEGGRERAPIYRICGLHQMTKIPTPMDQSLRRRHEARAVARARVLDVPEWLASCPAAQIG